MNSKEELLQLRKENRQLRRLWAAVQAFQVSRKYGDFLSERKAIADMQTIVKQLNEGNYNA